MRLFIPLYLTPGSTGIHLRAMRGEDEIIVEKADTATALALLDSMLDREGPGFIPAASIVTADRDRILASVYRGLFGSKIESTVTCHHCREPFDVDFSLTTLLEKLHPGKRQVPENGVYETQSGVTYRLPTGEDEIRAVLAEETDPVQALLNQCLIAGAEVAQAAEIQAQMAVTAPVINLEMQADCPECGTEQKARFDMQSFLLMRLKKERPRLLYEIHRIASAYHWSQHEILQLPRSLRKQYVDLIEAR